MRERLSEFHAQMLAIDPHESWASQSLLAEVGLETSDVRFPLLLDPACIVSATYGVAFQMRIHTELSNRPATFIIDRDGVIQYARRATTFADRPSPDEVLNVLNKLK